VTSTRVRVTMMLCDHAQVAGGKLYLAGGGWTITSTPTQQSAVAVLFHIPWNETNRKVKFSLRLVSADGRTVTQPGLGGSTPVEASGELEVGRPPGLPEGSTLVAPFAANIPPLLLAPGRYVWQLQVDDRDHEDWQVSFLARQGPVDSDDAA
jgi:hypothetical protein